MPRTIGLDLNGWSDHGCRDWNAEDPDIRLSNPVSLDGGIRSVIVQHGSVHVGGPEAILSPIGRGNGWSDVGALSKRRFLSDHLDDLGRDLPGPHFDGDIRAAVRCLSQQASRAMLCIPDHAGFKEAGQKRLLEALNVRGLPQPTLIWRSVALVLGLLDGNELPLAGNGMRIACIIHGADGLERQILVLRTHAGELAPERDGPGTIVSPEIGLSRLLVALQNDVARANPHWNPVLSEAPRMPGDLLMGDTPVVPEVIRRDNGFWIKLQPPEDRPVVPQRTVSVGPSIEADIVLVLSPLSSRHESGLRTLIAEFVAAPKVIFASRAIAARGAWFAAQRIERGVPHYLDRLDPIALAVMRRDGPAFVDLIPPHESVPGNREYVSKALLGFKWDAGMTAAEFYLRKGTSEVRKWHAPVGVPPDLDQPLSIQLRQTPAQGWATLSITALEWDALRRTPIRLEWDSLTPEPRSEAEILLALQPSRPAIPERVCYEAHLGLWDGSLRRPGLSQILRTYRRGDPKCLVALRQGLSNPYSRPAYHANGAAGPFHAISTDGKFPPGLPQSECALFTRILNEIAEDLLASLHQPSLLPPTNDALLCLTWSFAACPVAIQREVYAAFHDASHGFRKPVGGVIVVEHGLGRVTRDACALKNVLPDLLARLPATNVLAPLASMLSRPIATPAVLAELDIESAGGRLQAIFAGLVSARKFAANYKYARLALAGLLRVRAHHPWALTTSHSAAGRLMAATLRSAMTHLMHPEYKRQLSTTEGLLEYLATNKGRHDILTSIDSEQS